MTDGRPTALLVGPPNAGKSTLFNRLCGASARTGNYAGTTVSVQRAPWSVGPHAVDLVDLPGTTSLVAHSADEEVTLRAILGGGPRAVVVVVLDAPRLARSLYVALQVAELGVPIVLAVNLVDEAREAGMEPDAARLGAAFGVPCVAVSGRTGEGVDALTRAVAEVLDGRTSGRATLDLAWPPALAADVAVVAEELPAWAGDEGVRRSAVARWALQSARGAAEAARPVPEARIASVRAAARASGRDVDAELVGARYAWIDARLAGFARATGGADRPAVRAERLDRVLLHPVFGSVALLGVAWAVFTALFSWSDAAVGWLEERFADLGDAARGLVDGFAGGEATGLLAVLRDLAVDGVIAGVGGVLVFLPQIAVLFLLLAILDDVGYLARAAALADRLLRRAGLPGRAFVPLVSGFACAVPAILATRTLPRRRDRLLAMAVLPLTTCSARLPVYALVLGALFPPSLPGLPVPLRPLMLLAMYGFSLATTLLAAVVLGRLVLPAEAEPTVLELPPYRLPSARSVARTVVARCGDFVREAGGPILVATVALWALLAFPRHAPEDVLPAEVLAEALAEGADLDALAAPYAVEASFGGQLGHLVEPVLAPLGFDWKIGVGLIGAFAAREVFVSTMGVVYGLAEADETSETLRERVRSDRRPDGTPLWTPATGLSLLVFVSLAMQCTSTLAVLRKESGGWRWPAFVLAYMTSFAWVGAFVTYQTVRLLGG